MIKNKGLINFTWRPVNVLLLIILLIASFIMISPIKDSLFDNYFIEVSWDSGHVFYFAFLTYLLYKYIPVLSSVTLLQQYLYVGIACLVLGLCIELTQMLTQRSASLPDLLYNVVGGIAGVTIFSPKISELGKGTKIPLLVLVFGLITSTFSGPIAYVINIFTINQTFPVVNTFELLFEQQRWHGNATIIVSKDKAREGNQSLKVKFEARTFSGVKLEQVYPDWSGYKLMSLDIYNDQDDEVNLILGIYDEHDTNTQRNYSNRFNEKLILNPGWNKIRLPLSDIKNGPKARTLSLTQIAGMMIYAMRLKSPVTIYIDNIHLEN